MNIKKTVLAIEDEQKLVDVYQKKFEELGVTTLKATTGQEGLSLAKTKPDLIILDIMIPGGLNGFDVLGSLKRDPELKDIPVLVLTNLDGEEKTAKELGAIDYVVKTDMSINDLFEKIRKLLHL